MSRLVNPGFFADAYLVTIALAAHVGTFPWIYGMSESVAATPNITLVLFRTRALTFGSTPSAHLGAPPKKH